MTLSPWTWRFPLGSTPTTLTVMLADRLPFRSVSPSLLLSRAVFALTTLSGLKPLGRNFTAMAGMPKNSSTLAEIDESAFVSVVASFLPADFSETSTVRRSPGKRARTSPKR